MTGPEDRPGRLRAGRQERPASTARKAHILRAKPPWRQDLTRCGRNPDGLRLITPDAGMRMQAAMVWKWRLVAAVSPQMVPCAVQQINRPEGLCSVCWLNLGEPRRQDWTAGPLGVLGLTPDNRQDAERLAGELRALACLAVRHPAGIRGPARSRAGPRRARTSASRRGLSREPS